MNTQTLTILGSTGSIGCNTLAVLAQYPEQFRIFALTGVSQIEKLAQQCLQFQPQYAVVADEQSAQTLRDLLRNHRLPTQVLHGSQALIDVASADEVTGVMAAIVGAAGLPATLAAAQKGKIIYLANKETLVVAGDLFMQTARQHQAQILPVDSEHNAIFQVLPRDFHGNFEQTGVASLILTASGGPFLNLDLNQMAHITPEMAIKHPNWQMGKKISVDSATMMNKGLELIEAHHLFQCPPDKLEVLIHPQSVIHSMVRYQDGSVLAQLGTPDMRTPIAYCLGLPTHQRLNSGVAPLDFTQLNALTFLPADPQRFPCLKLAYQAMQSRGAYPAILNAANEIAVQAFLDNRIVFTAIADTVEHTLNAVQNAGSFASLEALLSIDQESRHVANAFVQQHYA